MQYEKHLTVKKDGEAVEYLYYVKENKESEFDCKMYNVGIRTKKRGNEIEDFSPSLEEAVAFCDYLYRENVSADNIFLVGEEFISCLDI